MTIDLAARIERSSLRAYASSLLEFVRPAIELRPVAGTSADELPLGCTHSGGVPDVGPGFEWPRTRSPLSFLLQVNLAELASLPAATPLPPAGWLSFFYDLVRQPWGGHPRLGAASWRVLFTPPDAPVHRAGAPRFRSDRAVLPPVALAPVAIETLPHELPIDLDDEIYWSAEDVYSAEILPPDNVPSHQMLGYSRPIQNDVHGTATSADGSWVSLLQLDSDDRLGTMFGDAGKLHFTIPLDSLLLRQFDAVDLELQCC